MLAGTGAEGVSSKRRRTDGAESAAPESTDRPIPDVPAVTGTNCCGHIPPGVQDLPVRTCWTMPW